MLGTTAMDAPTLFHDPTSEPSRAVHWFSIEAGIALEIEYVWLTRGEHTAPGFLAVNPAHQVPALRHGDFCLAEASAIMTYLAELAGKADPWIGGTPVERAITHRFLSWHHTNTRLKLTLNYLLPVLLLPAYRNVARPESSEVRRLRTQGRESLELLDRLLVDRGHFLGGGRPSIADLLIASDLFALDIDPERDELFGGLDSLNVWLEGLRRRDGYGTSHAAWNAIVPMIQGLIASSDTSPRDPGWVAEACIPHLG